MTWYYALNGQRLGPISAKDLAALASTGALTGDTLVWSEGMTAWVPLLTALPSALNTPKAGEPQLGGIAVRPERKAMVIQQVREAVCDGVPGDVEYGTIWARFIAKTIDGLILMAPSFLMNKLMAMMIGYSPRHVTLGRVDRFDSSFVLYLAAVILASVVLGGLYNIVLLGKYGATFGKMAVGLKVVNEREGKISYWRATGRFFAEYVSSLTLGIGYLLAIADSERRALHDQMCSTRVISTL